MAKAPKQISRPWIEAKKPFGRNYDLSDFYNSRRWRKVSKAYREANPICECEDCVNNNLVKPAQVCDHKRGLKFLLDNGYDPYDWSELQSMSYMCHNKKSGRSSRKGGMG